MNQLYKVYKRQNDVLPFISIGEPTVNLRSKRIYTGKKAKIEAIFRLSGEMLPSTLTTSQVNDYIAKNIFKTPLWDKYHKIFQSVANEVKIIEENYQYQYDIIVDIADGYTVNDPDVIRDIANYLLGVDTCYKTIKRLTIQNGR